MTEAQVRPDWRPPAGVLGELVAAAEVRAAALRRRGGSAPGVTTPAARSPGRFTRALIEADGVAVIAEIKRRSPSKGVLRDELRAADAAAAYVAGGAAAISVLTEPSRFGGAIDDLTAVRDRVSVPVLRKDFIVDAVQVREAAAAGADAVLLIARALDPERARDLAAEAAAEGLDVLFEVRDEGELARGIAIAGCVIGVNTRNLETLAIDVGVAERLLPQVPPDRVAVYESGIEGRADVERAARLGAHAVLVGSALSVGGDPVAAVRGMAGVPRAAAP